MGHANARLTVHGRLLLVQRVVADQRPVAHVAKELGVSRQCAHRWVARFRAEGVAGLADRSSRPRRSPRRTSPGAEASVLAARRDLRCGPAGIAAATGVPARTVTRVLTRHRVPRLAECDPLTGDRIRASKATAVRYERSRPGELVHMDVKKIARIPDGGGWKALGRHQRETTRNRKTKIGYDYIHCLVDDHSRLAYAEVLTDEKGPTCAAFLERAAAYFAEHGITRIERLMTDNAWAYKWSLRGVCHGDGSPLLPAYLLVTTDGAAVAEVSEYDVGAYEDPDGGRRLVVSRDYYRRPGDRHRRLRHPTTASTLETAAAEALSAAWIS